MDKLETSCFAGGTVAAVAAVETPCSSLETSAQNHHLVWEGTLRCACWEECKQGLQQKYAHRFIAALFTTAKKWEQPKDPPDQHP